MKIYTKEILTVQNTDDFNDIKRKYDRKCNVRYNCSKCGKSIIGNLRNLTSFPTICGNCKGKFTKIAKYGESGISIEGIKRLSEIQKKNAKVRMAKTAITKEKRYGDRNYNNQEKAIDTKLKAGSLYDRDKHIKTCREKYGVDFYFQTEEFKTKVRDTISKIDGNVNWPSQLQISKDNSKRTCRSKYGVPYSLQSSEVRDKILNTCLSKYGLTYAPSHFAPARSILEDSVLEFLDTLSEKYVTNNRTLLHGKEIDIYFPELKKAIEVQGTYWHADPRIYEATYYNKAKNMYASDIWEYDANKAESINKLGITIFYLWEIDWNSNNDSVKNDLKEFLKNG